MSDQAVTMPHRDPNHPGNRIRPRVRCVGCKAMGCVTAWGPWCFACNVPRMDRLGRQFDQIERNLAALDAAKGTDAPSEA